MAFGDAQDFDAFFAKLERDEKERTTTATIEVDGDAIPNLDSFSYSSDVMTLGDPFSVAIPDPRRKYTAKLKVGASVKFRLSNPGVNGGAEAQKVDGILVDREASSEGGKGTVITIKGADKGWHLVENDGPFWTNLRGVRFQTLLERVLDAGWGFKGTRAENDTNRALKLGRAGAQLALSPDVAPPLYVLQIEPGEKIADTLILFAKREGKLLNVSADGYLQFFTPNYAQAAPYRIEYHEAGTEEAKRNNAQRAQVSESCKSIYTKVVCVGESVRAALLQTGENPNAGKFRGEDSDPKALPFPHVAYFSDGEQLSPARAKQRAKWRRQRGIFDSWTATYTVRGHHCNGVWWESDTMCDVNDTVNGVVGTFYVPAIRCNRDMRSGDYTEVTLKKPSLLGA